MSIDHRTPLKGYWTTLNGRLITTYDTPSRWEKFWRWLVYDWYWTPYKDKKS